MERDYQPGLGGQPETGRAGDPPGPAILTILRRYSAGEISARQAARAMGPQASEHDVFAGILAAHLPLPVPPPEDLAREVAALRMLYGAA